MPTSAVNAGSFVADTYLRVTKRLITTIALLAGLFVLAPAASASVLWVPDLDITGDPTATEHSIIRGTWTVVKAGLPGADHCLGEIEVMVVDRAEDYFTAGNYAIASFYRGGPEPIIFVEHGKVTAANLAHEFAHHIDVSCDMGSTPLAADFLAAAGFSPNAAWYSGSSWGTVPAEQFAEGILAVLDIGPLAIEVPAAAVDLIAERLAL
jgi:hypothetical protein